MKPEIDGVEVCRQIKSSSETEGIAIVMVTALSDTENKEKAFKVGANGYLTKPIKVSDLTEAINATGTEYLGHIAIASHNTYKKAPLR